MIYRRRPIVTARAAQALMIRTLGSGSNGIGYYMYHGGSTPLRQDNIGSYQDEPMGMPKISYDLSSSWRIRTGTSVLSLPAHHPFVSCRFRE